MQVNKQAEHENERLGRFACVEYENEQGDPRSTSRQGSNPTLARNPVHYNSGHQLQSRKDCKLIMKLISLTEVQHRLLISM